MAYALKSNLQSIAPRYFQQTIFQAGIRTYDENELKIILLYRLPM